MQCDGFLQGYSEFVDGRLPAGVRMAFQAHLDACEPCARYHRIVQRGLFIYRNLPSVESSPDFLPRLEHRLYHVDDAERLAARTPLGSAALVAVAAVGFLALAWLPFATRLSVEVQLPAVAVEAPSEEPAAPSLFGPGPFVLPAAGYVPAAGYGAPVGWGSDIAPAVFFGSALPVLRRSARAPGAGATDEPATGRRATAPAR